MLNLPINPLEILKSTKALDAQRSVPVALGLFVDPMLDEEIIEKLTMSFVPQTKRGRVTLDVLSPEKEYAIHKDSQAVVLVIDGIESPAVECALAAFKAASEKDIPVVVVSTSGRKALIALRFSVGILDCIVEETGEEILGGIASWFASNRSEYKLALASNFSWMRKKVAAEYVSKTAVQNGGVGVLGFIPGADLPVMTLNQAKMVMQIASAYSVPLTGDRVKELLVVVGSGFAFRAIARSVVGLVPVIGWAVKGAIGFSGTMALGYAAIEYFEDGGDLEGVKRRAKELKDSIMLQKPALHKSEKPAGIDPADYMTVDTVLESKVVDV